MEQQFLLDSEPYFIEVTRLFFKLCAYLQALYSDGKRRVKLRSKLPKEFKILMGLKQGCSSLQFPFKLSKVCWKQRHRTQVQIRWGYFDLKGLNSKTKIQKTSIIVC